MTTPNSEYVQAALDYCKGVVAGEIVAGKLTRLACQRQLDDLERDWEYRFDEEAAHKFCAFASALPHVKGEWARRKEALKLEPWQCFVYTTKYGWLHKESGLRRFRTSYLEVARKNAKTTVAAAEALYLLTEDREPGAEVYSAAVDREQASIVWNIAKQMVQKSPKLAGYYGVKTMAHSIVVSEMASAFRPLSRDAHSLEGLNPHGAIIDELHAHKTREVWDVIESGTGARQQPLISTITTAGSDRSGICYEQRTYAVRILEGAVKDESYFACVYTIDEDDDWADEAVWPKANPNLGVSVYLEDLRRKALKAREAPAAQANFLTKHQNVWVNADYGLFDPLAWEQCKDETLELEQFLGKPCWVGIDLAMKDDFCAMATLFDLGGEWRAFVKFWLPDEAIEQSKNSQYRGWAASKKLQSTPGDVIDFDDLEDEIADHCKLVKPQKILYDPWSATQTGVHLQSRGLPMEEMAQTLRNLSEATKMLRAVMSPNRLRHDGNPVMAWMISNVVGKYDTSENVKPKKQYEDHKIDGPIALIMCFAAALRAGEAPKLRAGSVTFA